VEEEVLEEVEEEEVEPAEVSCFGSTDELFRRTPSL